MTDNRFTASLKKNYERFVKIRGNPREIALGFALGLFIGMSPTMGIQMFIAVFFAAVLKWSKIAAAAGVWISNPFTAPFLYWFTYYIGAKLLSYKMRHPLPRELNLDALICLLKQAPEILWIMTVGGIVVGIPIAAAGYYFSLSAILKYRERIQQTIAKEKEVLSRTKENIKKKIAQRKKKKRR
ncbi:MAG: DUF2062 domain-containing protein [Desulfobacterales bacterium]